MISSDFFSGWGIRTIAKGEPRYNRMSYHNGSIWPHDNSFIALGLSRYGFRQHVDKIFEAMFGTASFMELRRLPELFCGFRRRSGAGPTLYPVSCSPQAWASGSSLFDDSGRARNRIRSGRKSDPLPQSATPPFLRPNCLASTSAERRNGRRRTQGLRIACFDVRPAKHRSRSSFDDCQLNA
jgi:hypothetical protein